MIVELFMRKITLISAFAALVSVPAIGLADTVVIKPEVDAWIMKQPDNDAGLDIDLSIGSDVPDKVTVVDVPDDERYSYVVVKKKRVLVDRKTRKVVKIYE
jgi:hypothetical protein